MDGRQQPDDTAATPIDDATDLFGLDGTGKPYLSCLREYRLDGVILSNEEPYSFSVTGERDSTVFNIGIKGPAPTNNGFLTYKDHAATELYARNADPTAYGETLRIGSERAGDTWHGKIGYDFVAAYTSVYTEYPLQMFDREVRALDTVYLLLRKYNLEDDVIAPRVAALMANNVTRVAGTEVVDGVERVKYVTKPEFDDAGKARDAVVASMKVFQADGKTPVTLTKDKAKTMVFFQYMPCSSRAFAQYHETLKAVDAAVETANVGAFTGLLHVDRGKGSPKGLGSSGGVRNNFASSTQLKILETAAEGLQCERQGKGYRARRRPLHRHPHVRGRGDWQGRRHALGARDAVRQRTHNASYRMTVTLDIEWLARNKKIVVAGATAANAADKIAEAARNAQLPASTSPQRPARCTGRVEHPQNSGGHGSADARGARALRSAAGAIGHRQRCIAASAPATASAAYRDDPSANGRVQDRGADQTRRGGSGVGTNAIGRGCCTGSIQRTPANSHRS